MKQQKLDKQQILANKLRENLKKRKQQAKIRNKQKQQNISKENKS